jgi:hypothetical protein
LDDSGVVTGNEGGCQDSGHKARRDKKGLHVDDMLLPKLYVSLKKHMNEIRKY